MNTTMASMNQRLAVALRLCGEEDADWVTHAQLALSHMQRHCTAEEILGAAKLWLDGGYECLRQRKTQPEPGAVQADKGNSMLRIAVDYMVAGGDNEGLIRLAREQSALNMRLALRAWESVTDDQAFGERERHEMLALADQLKPIVENVEDAKRICDAYARLGCKNEIVRFADELEMRKKNVCARHVRLRIQEMELPSDPAEACVD